MFSSILIGVIFACIFLSPINVYANIFDNNTFNPASLLKKEPPISVCDKTIKKAGIPIDGISGWPVTRIDFRPEATEAQKAQAWEIVNNFDYEKELAALDKKTASETSSFKISPDKKVDAISGEEMKAGDFVIGMIDKNLQNGGAPEDGSLNGTWIKWDNVKKDLIKEIKNGAGSISLDASALDASAPAGADAGGAGGAGTGGSEQPSRLNLDVSSMVDAVKNVILSLGISIKDGVTNIVNLAAEKFFAKTARIERLEMVDKATGDIYCTWVENGEWQKVKGSCELLESAGAVLQPSLAPTPINHQGSTLMVTPTPTPTPTPPSDSTLLLPSPTPDSTPDSTSDLAPTPTPTPDLTPTTTPTPDQH